MVIAYTNAGQNGFLLQAPASIRVDLKGLSTPNGNQLMAIHNSSSDSI